MTEDQLREKIARAYQKVHPRSSDTWIVDEMVKITHDYAKDKVEEVIYIRPKPASLETKEKK